MLVDILLQWKYLKLEHIYDHHHGMVKRIGCSFSLETKGAQEIRESNMC